MKSPFPGRGSRSPLHFPLFPLNCQRRWSEAGVAEASGDSGDETRRRWSMPWDTAWGETVAQGQQRYLPSKLAVPSGYSQEKSRSTTPGKYYSHVFEIQALSYINTNVNIKSYEY